MLSIAADSIHRRAPVLRRASVWRLRIAGYGRGALALLIALCTASFSASLGSAVTFSGERWVVIVGISDYEDKDLRLRFADRDAEAFKEFLKTPRGGGFADDHIRFLPNRKATAESIREALGTFLGRAKPEDYVVIFLAGHGLPDPRDANDFYFLPYNADLTRLPSTAVPMWEVQRWVDKIEAQRVLLIADACHSGAMGSKGIARGPNEINRYLQRLGESYQTVMTLTSSSGHQLSQEDKKWGSGHGVFTYYLLRALQADAEQADKDNDGIVDAEEAYLYIVTQVIADTDGEQVPDRSGDLGSGIPLAVVSPGGTQPSKITLPVPKGSGTHVQALLRECAAHLKAHRLTTGRGGNAVDCYTAALKLDRGNTEALAGLDQVVAKYAEWSERAIARRQFEHAETYLQRLAQVNPEYPRLMELRGRLTEALLSQADAQLTEELLTEAEQQLDEGRLTAPPDDNAYASYQQVLELDPGNTQADQGLQQIAERFVALAKEKQAAENLKASLNLVKQGLLVQPDHSRLQALQTEIEDALKAQEKVQLLLTEADQHFEAERLTNPPGNNAFETLREVLEKDAGNPRARRMLEAIAERFETSAQDTYKRGHLRQSLSIVEKGLRLFPENDNLLALQKKLMQEFGTVESLLARAKQQLRVGQLTTPAGANAYDTLSTVLELDRQNQEALKDLETIPERCATMALAKKQEGKAQHGLSIVEDCLHVFRQNSQLLALREELQQPEPPPKKSKPRPRTRPPFGTF